MKLSKREAKCRAKLIQENHYNKGEQRILDEAAAEMPRSYKDLYASHRLGIRYWYTALISANRLSRAAYASGVAAEKAAKSFSMFTDATKKTLGGGQK